MISPDGEWPAPAAGPGPDVAIGVYTPGAPGDMRRVRRIEALLGRRLSIVHWAAKR